jgi:hypothetical protein
VTAATYETFQPRPSRKSAADIQKTLSSHASPSVESAIRASPVTCPGRRPIRSTSQPITSTSAYMPTMWRLITVKTSLWWWPWSITT